MRSLLPLVILPILLTVGAQAQTAAGTGAVNGVVRDPYGEGLPGADVVLSNAALGFRRTLETTIDGVFDAVGLFPARGYRLEVTRRGFTGWESGELEVGVGKPLIFDISLPEEPKDDASKDQAGVLLLDGPETGPAIVITRRHIDDLPIRGRRLDALVMLAPSLAVSPQSGRPAFLGHASTYPILIDGIATENTASALSAGLGTRVSQDSVESLQVLNGGFPAQLGSTIGGIVNAATRSGTSAFHGSVYHYYRDPDWTSAGRYALGRNLADREHQPGASVGGPIVRDRLHFFANYEARDSKSQVLNRFTSPLIATANCQASAAQCAAARQFIEGQMDVLAPSSMRSSAAIGKLDYLSGEGSAFRLEYRDSLYRWPEGLLTEAVAPNGGVLGQAGLRVRSRYFKAGWTAALGASGVNELALGSFRERLSRSGRPTGLSTGPLAISVAGVTLGAADSDRANFRELHRNQIGDQIRATAGSHTVQIGVFWSESPTWIDEFSASNGAYQYGGLTEFARDLSGEGKNYALFRQSLGQADRKQRIRDFSVYAQDSWRAMRRLSVDGGLRWDKAVLPQPVAADSTYFRTGIIPSPNLAFSARVGAAYLLDDHTVARFGFGLFYSPFSGEFIDTLLLGSARRQLNILVNRTYTASPAFPNFFTLVANAPAGTKNLAYAGSKIFYPYTPQTTVSIERRLGGDTLVAARYVASPGNRLLTARDMNLTETTTSRTYTLLDAAGQTAGSFETPVVSARGSTNFSHVFEIGNGGSSSYHAGVLQLHKGMAHGLSAQASYTWSRAISNVNGPWVVPSVPTSTSGGEPNGDRGTGNTDQRHRLAMSWSWRPMLSPGAPAMARHLLNNWQQSAVVTLASALPETALVVVSGQQFTGTNMLYTTTLNGSDAWARVPFYPINSLRKEAEYNMDVRLARIFPVGEAMSASLAVEVFNLFDRQFNTGVNTTAFSASGGVLTPVSGLGAGNMASAPRSAQVAFRFVF